MSPIIIKVGGALIDDAIAAAALFDNIRMLADSRQVVLVHGGGALIETWMHDLGLASQKLDGLRVTPDAHMPYVCGALAGTANTALCALAKTAGLTPVGLSLVDGNMVHCKPMPAQYGAVGTAAAGDNKLLHLLLQMDFLPVVSSIGSDESGRLLNINADQAATAVAQVLQGELLLLSNVPGVLDAHKQLIASLHADEIDRLVKAGVITEGMKVKTDAALLATSSLNRAVTIGSWAEPLTNILEGKSGTQVYPQHAATGDI